MKNKRLAFFLLFLGALSLSGCKKQETSDGVIAQHYTHKYGYPMSKAEWDSQVCPGQVITLRQDGVTVTATYDGGVLNGPTVYTFPHSQAVQKVITYKEGVLVRELFYNSMGMPEQEHIQLSPSRYSTTMWYADGIPMLIEEWLGNELLEGQYFATRNELDAQVEKGCGSRIVRDAEGILVSSEQFENGYPLKKEEYHRNGVPKAITHFKQDKIDGEKRVFSPLGEPVSVEEYKDGLLHGCADYYSCGNKVAEVLYIAGKKNGVERRYIDGTVLFEEITWDNDVRHGPTTLFLNQTETQKWFYEGVPVSKKKFDESCRLDELTATYQIETSSTDK